MDGFVHGMENLLHGMEIFALLMQGLGGDDWVNDDDDDDD